ncbi:MAG: class I SAM-dependent methyltransferase [Magnetococcales bacterium]|nr:class I SAM-dependent methyltransferase [Magnetococcales bacterium]
MVDPRQFWNDKILGWERDRYGLELDESPTLEKIASHASSSLRRRMALAGQLILPHIQGKRVVELGCGSGVLAESLIQAGAASYVGYDIAPAAVEGANARVKKEGLSDRIQFKAGDFSAESAPFEADQLFSLGLFDWLTHQQIEGLFRRAPKALHLHSISEKRRSLSQLAHRIYVHFAYGHRTQGYKPRYFSVDEMNELASPHLPTPLRPIRDRGMSFGIFLTNIPKSQEEGDD